MLGEHRVFGMSDCVRQRSCKPLDSTVRFMTGQATTLNTDEHQRNPK